MYVLHGRLKNKLNAIAAQGFVWRGVIQKEWMTMTTILKGGRYNIFNKIVKDGKQSKCKPNLDITKIVRNMFQKSFILSCLYEYLISEFGAFAQFSFLTNIETLCP